MSDSIGIQLDRDIFRGALEKMFLYDI